MGWTAGYVRRTRSGKLTHVRGHYRRSQSDFQAGLIVVGLVAAGIIWLAQGAVEFVQANPFEVGVGLAIVGTFLSSWASIATTRDAGLLACCE